MDVLTTAKGQAGLPRYFAAAFDVASKLGEGRLDFVLPDGRRFRAEGKAPGLAAEIRVVDPDVFARLIRDGDLGFCDSYLEGAWTSPDLQAFLDLIQLPVNNIVGDSFPGLALVRAYERMRAAGVEFTQEPVERYGSVDAGFREAITTPTPPARITAPRATGGM